MKCPIEVETSSAVTCCCWGACVFKALCLLVIAKSKTSRLLVNMRWVCIPGRQTHQALFHLSYLLALLCKIDSLRHCETPPTWLCPREPVSHRDNSFLGSWYSEVLPHPPHPTAHSIFSLLFSSSIKMCQHFPQQLKMGTVFSAQFPSKHT